MKKSKEVKDIQDGEGKSKSIQKKEDKKKEELPVINEKIELKKQAKKLKNPKLKP